jgi:predicted ATPase/DNA-binding winged helix-turn-helix (wHTH) protein
MSIMNGSHPLPDRWCFGPYELRLDVRTLCRNGAQVGLGGRAFDLLAALIEARERVVCRGELVERVWPQRVVEENNLAVQVLALRRVLGERAIATVPGRGYRFVLPVDDVSPSAAAHAAAATRPVVDLALPAAPSTDPGQAVMADDPHAVLHGRADELLGLTALLASHRLVSVVGAGGIGKSTLAAAVARAQRQSGREVVWIDLDAIGSARQLPVTVAQALGVQSSERDTGFGALAVAVAMRRRDVLLVLDSAEHLIDAVARLVHDLLQAGPALRLLVTSQVPVKVEGEHVLRLDPLAMPPGDTLAAEALRYGAIALFVEQVRAADPRFVFDDGVAAGVIEICRQVDGLALAIKLAAARVPALGLRTLNGKLAQSMRVLGGGLRHAPTRQHTLHATLAWSHGLLGDAAQRVFRRLGVFRSGFTLAQAQGVAVDDTLDEWAVIEQLADLVDRSLVIVGPGDPPRYQLLASAREYARNRLDDAGELAAVRHRHAGVMADHMHAAVEALWSSTDTIWLQRHGPEIDNLRAALSWSLDHHPALATQLLGRSEHLFDACTLRHEFRRLCARHESTTPMHDEPGAALYRLGCALSLTGLDHVRLQQHAACAHALYQQLDDARGRYLALCVLVFGHASTVATALQQRRVHEALALERADWPARLRSWGWLAQAVACTMAGDLPAARDMADAGYRLAHGAGADWNAHLLRNWRLRMDILMRRAGTLQEAAEMVRQARARPNGYVSLTQSLQLHALLAAHETAAARQALVEFADFSRAVDWDAFDHACDLCVLLALRESRLADALRLVGYAQRVLPTLGMLWPQSRALHQRVCSAAMASLGEPACALLLAQGRACSCEAACAYALAAPPR